MLPQKYFNSLLPFSKCTHCRQKLFKKLYLEHDPSKDQCNIIIDFSRVLLRVLFLKELSENLAYSVNPCVSRTLFSEDILRLYKEAPYVLRPNTKHGIPEYDEREIERRNDPGEEDFVILYKKYLNPLRSGLSNANKLAGIKTPIAKAAASTELIQLALYAYGTANNPIMGFCSKQLRRIQLLLLKHKNDGMRPAPLLFCMNDCMLIQRLLISALGIIISYENEPELKRTWNRPLIELLRLFDQTKQFCNKDVFTLASREGFLREKQNYCLNCPDNKAIVLLTDTMKVLESCDRITETAIATRRSEIPHKD